MLMLTYEDLILRASVYNAQHFNTEVARYVILRNISQLIASVHKKSYCFIIMYKISTSINTFYVIPRMIYNFVIIKNFFFEFG